MVVVAELILSSFITVLFAKLTSPELLNFLSREGIDTQLKKWSKTLIKIQAVLNDAEDKQITNQAVQLWLDDLQDLAYDLDDLLDEFASEALRSKLIMELEAQPQPQPQPQQPDEYDHHQATSTTSKLVLRKLLFPTCCTSFTPRAIWFNSNMRTKIDDITSRFDDISKTKNDLDLKESHTVRIGSRSSNRVRERLPTTSLPESHVYGREEDKGAILEQLLTAHHEASDDGLVVIPIQGMGGVGKTTLAQQLYNDDRVNGWFDAKAWACVTDDFDIFRVTKTILESFTKKSCDFKDLNMLPSLNDKLSGKKFLLVLDDLWNENYEEWDVLRRPFLAGAIGSRVIVTTRNRSVASITGTLSGSTYHLKQLSNEDCLSLFARHALGRENFGEHPNLKAMGEEIVKRCKGLPLAAKTLGGLLRTKLEQSDWEDILNSKIWDLPKQRTGILPALHLSYHHLPSHLKRCFAYCSIFPKDYEFDKDELVLLWMAEGFLQPSEGKKRLMDFGRKCFDDLLSRSLFQQSSSKTLKSELKFVMHDLLNDLAEYVALGICFRLDNEGQHEVSKRARHSSFTRQEYEVVQKFKPFHKVQSRLRTFLPLPVHKLDSWREYHLNSQVLVDLLPKLQCLRVLSLSGYSINELPDSIGNLKHLRYLDLSQTSIKNLPESVSTLYNLQTLLLSNCEFLCKLPSKIGNLINLHCLDIAETRKLQEMPSGICKLTSLQTLSKIVLGTSNGLRLRELGDLSLLCGKLSIEGLQNVMDISDAEEANLKSKHMDGLVMDWSNKFCARQNSPLQKDLLDKLRPHQCLESLEIKFYWGMEFPSWIGDPTFSQITKISLKNCGKCTSLPTLGQLPLLKDLVIQGMNKVKRVGEEFYKYNDCPLLELPFPQLETLCFVGMHEWEEWFSSSGVLQFPCLRELKISSCPKLNRVPLLSLPTLRVLQLKHCDKVMLKSVVNLTSLTELTIGRISDLTCLPKEFMKGLVALQFMRVVNWDELVTLWENGVELENLVRLEVLNCQKLVSLVGEEEQGLPRKLQILSIEDCANLEKIPNVFKRLTCLSPSTLTSLQISGPKALESLPDGNARLRYLNITGHSGRPTRYISHGLEMTQKDCIVTLRIKCSGTDLPNIGTLLGSMQTTFANLFGLFVVSCDGIESFPELTSFSTPNLRQLVIRNCKNLKLLCDQIHSLTSLGSLEMRECPSLDSFPQRDMPPKLKSLEICECEKLRPLSEWGLHRLTSLRTFTIEGGWPELVSFPDAAGDDDDDDCLLFPPSLTCLKIGSFLNLKTLSSLRHQNLTSLRQLYVRKCPELRSLPQADLLLPLLRLDIEECSHLTQRCLKDKCDYWPQISHIPCLQIFQGVSDSERRFHNPWR